MKTEIEKFDYIDGLDTSELKLKGLPEIPRTDHIAESELVQGYWHWKNIAVSYYGGVHLLLRDRSPLRIPDGQQIDVAVDHISWQGAPDAFRIRSVKGAGAPRAGWKFPHQRILCVLFSLVEDRESSAGSYYPLREPCSLSAPNRFGGGVVGVKDHCVVQVNDVDHPSHYEDNGGGFDLYVKLV